MSSDGSSSDSDEEQENELSKQVAELEATLQSSPYYYEGHVQLIKLLRQQGDLDKARDARLNMSKIFPLSEDLWLEWFGDEIPLTGLSAELALELRLRFETATKDYLSVKIWLEYAQFAVDKMSVMPEGVEFPRDVFEQALIACGLHVSLSGAIWDAYLEFEVAMLQSLQAMQMESAEDEDLKQQVEKQYDRVDKLYKRRLSVTHVGMEEAFGNYQNMFSDMSITEESMPAYAAARRKLEEYLPFETQLATSDPPSVEVYRSYLDHLISKKANPSLINTLYLRAVTHHCLDAQIWREYLSFLDKNFRTVGDVLLPGYQMAVRNCPWMCLFWLGLVRGLERNGRSQEEVIATFEKALQDNFTSAEDNVAMWTAYCDFYLRLVRTDSPQHTHKDLIALFKRARNKLTQDFGKQGDPRDTLSRYHANVEKGVAEGHAIWEDVMTRHGKEAGYWMDFITYVRHREEGVEKCRKLFHQAINSVSDDIQRVCEAYLQFEREEGTLETFEGALVRTEAQMSRIKDRQEKAAEKEAQKREEYKKKKKLEKKAQKKKTSPQDASVGSQGSGAGSQRSNSVTSQESNGVGSQRSSDRKRTASHVFFKDSDEEDGPSEATGTKKPRVISDGEEDETANTSEKLPNAKNPDAAGGVASDVAMETDAPVRAEPEGSKEQRTVFVSNLPAEVNKRQLRERFSECGEVLEVRIVRSRGKFNRTNTFAYIEFFSPAPVSHALSLDRTEFMDKNMYVSPFRERGEKPASANRRSDRMSKSTVFVNNLQKDVTEDKLEQLFKQCGEVKEVRVVKNLQGRPKGYAYVEFVEESSALEAVEKLNSHFMGLKRIGVAMSNPPTTATPSGEGAGQGSVVEKGDGIFARPSFIPARAMQQQQSADDAPMARRSKTNISLMPRVLAKRGGADKSNTEPSSSQAAGQTKMSNEDFRKLFSK